jgi:hypothetical protein
VYPFFLVFFWLQKDVFFSNWLGGKLSGPKRPIFRQISQIFLTVAAATAYKNLLRLAKNGHYFCLRRDHANQLQPYLKI